MPEPDGTIMVPAEHPMVPSVIIHGTREEPWRYPDGTIMVPSVIIRGYGTIWVPFVIIDGTAWYHYGTINDNKGYSMVPPWYQDGTMNRAVKVTLPECIVECIARVYSAPPATAIRVFIEDVLTGRLERVDFDEECERCIAVLKTM